MFPFQKLRVWCSITSAEWKLGNIQFISGQNVHVSLSDGKVSSLEYLLRDAHDSFSKNTLFFFQGS